MDLGQIDSIVKIFLVPVIGWALKLEIQVKQNRKDLDRLYYEKRGQQGMRDRSFKGRIKRAAHGWNKS